MASWVLALAFGLPATAALAAGPPLQPQVLDPAVPANPGPEMLLRFQVPNRSGLLQGLETSLPRAAGPRPVASLDCRSAAELPVAFDLERTLGRLTAADHRGEGWMTRRGRGISAPQPHCRTLCILAATARPACGERGLPEDRGRSSC